MTYGKPIAVHIDPIEKKPLYHFLPGTDIFSLGTIGCNFQCGFCQNWDISQRMRETKKEAGNEKKVSELIQQTGEEWMPEKIIDYCMAQGIPSIAYTYNEPAIFFEYAFDTAKLGNRRQLKNVFVSNGYESKEAIETIEPVLDAINIDLKSFSEKFYQKNCKAKLEPVLETIKRVAKSRIWMEITTLLIPGENDSDSELKQIAEFLVSINPSIPWHITAFHPDYQMLDKKPTPPETLWRAYEIGKKAGLNFVYAGNVSNVEHSTTHCPRCEKALIVRDWHLISENHMQKGCCGYCGETIPGVWEK